MQVICEFLFRKSENLVILVNAVLENSANFGEFSNFSDSELMILDILFKNKNHLHQDQIF